MDMAPDTCPRCGAAFACGAAGATPCHCNALVLSATLRAWLAAQFDGCLCGACLRRLADDERRAAAAA